MNNFGIGTRLSVAFAAMLLITVGVALSGYRGMGRISATTFEMLAGDAEAARLADDARAQGLDLRRFEKDFLLNMGAPEKQAQYHRSWATAAEDFKRDLDTFAKLVNEAERAEIAAMTSFWLCIAFWCRSAIWSIVSAIARAASFTGPIAALPS